MPDPAPVPPQPARVPVFPFGDAALERAYQYCLLHAAVDEAFPEELTRPMFAAAFAKCASMDGLDWPPRKVKETTSMTARGVIPLSHKPSGPVKFYKGAWLVAVLPPDSPCLTGNSTRPNCDWDPVDIMGTPGTCCPPELCDCCGAPLTAEYPVGPLDCSSAMFDAKGNRIFNLPPMFLQAVARVFTFMIENRGDTQLDEHTLGKSNAMTFLENVTYVL